MFDGKYIFDNIDFLFKINSYAEPDFFRTPTRHNFLLALFNEIYNRQLSGKLKLNEGTKAIPKYKNLFFCMVMFNETLNYILSF